MALIVRTAPASVNAAPTRTNSPGPSRHGAGATGASTFNPNELDELSPSAELSYDGTMTTFDEFYNYAQSHHAAGDEQNSNQTRSGVLDTSTQNFAAIFEASDIFTSMEFEEDMRMMPKVSTSRNKAIGTYESNIRVIRGEIQRTGQTLSLTL